MSTHQKIATNENKQNENMQLYYKLHAKIYDATRWTFLFGRIGLVQELKKRIPNPGRILEIGCGTGYNLARLAKAFPNAQLTGIDVSGDMIAKAKKNLKAYADRTSFQEAPYMKGDTQFNNQIDIILFSYSLTMINPQWKDLIDQAVVDLKPGGVIAATDFHDSQFQWFKNHMGNNHVRMDGHLVPYMEERFETDLKKTPSAYLGVWEYFMYIGKKV